MALNFGKIDRAASFNRISAFPLDARSYFESMAEATAAAQSAKAAGDTTTYYYYGQTISVVENGVASFYVIQPDNTLAEVGGKVTVDENAFVLDDDGKLNLLGFADAVAGAQLLKGADGKLSWVKPDQTTVEGLQTTVAGLQEDIARLEASLNGEGGEGGIVKDVADLETAVGTPSEEGKPATGIYKDIEDINTELDEVQEQIGTAATEAGAEATGLYKELDEVKEALDTKAEAADVYTKKEVYTKEEVYTKTEVYSKTEVYNTTEIDAKFEDVYTKTETDEKIAAEIAAIDHLKRTIVNSVDDIKPAEDHADEFIYMVPATETEDGDTYDEYMVINGAVERVGDWKVDLSDYAKTADVNGALALKADQTAVNGALALKADISYVDAEIDKVEEVVAEKADTSALTSAVEAIEAELALKAAKSVVDEHGNDILALQQGLAAAATKEELQSLTDIVNAKADQSALEALDAELGNAPVYETQTNEETGEEEKVLVTPGTGVYSIVYTKEETADLIAQITGGESAADVLASLNTYKGTNDAAVKALQDKDAAIDAQIAALQQQADQAINILEGVEINGEALDIVEKHVNIPVAGALLGVVKSSEAENAVKVAEDGTMSVNSLNVNKLTQTEGEKLILYGGSSDK